MITISNQIELRHLRYFLAVAKELHFRKAAETLHISQPGLSRQIHQLEEMLGYDLFERNNKRVKLTASGAFLVEEIELIFRNLNATFEHAALIDTGNAGTLKLGYVGSAMQNVVPALLNRCRESLPSLRFALEELENKQQIQFLLEQKLDLGFVRLERVPHPLKKQDIFEDTFSLVLPKSHKLSQKNFEDLSQVKDESFILFEKSYSNVYYDTVMSIFEDACYSPEISHFSAHANTVFRLVENKFGLSIVPSSMQLGNDMKLKFIELHSIAQRTTLSAVWNTESRSGAVGKVLEVLLND